MKPSETNRQQFLELVENHQGILHRICFVYADQLADRQDLFQEMVLQLWRSFGSFRAESDFTTWMYRVALNTALLQRRRAGRRPKFAPWEDAPPSSLQVEIPPPNDDVEVLQACIRELPSLDRALVLLYLEERSYDEIAEVTGLSRNNVSVRLVRLKERLRCALEQKGLGKEAFQ